jgi:hypothetical protein
MRILKASRFMWQIIALAAPPVPEAVAVARWDESGERYHPCAQ